MKKIYILALLSFTSCYFVRSSIHNVKNGDVSRHGPLKDDLLEVMERNPNFNYANATEQEIYAVFGETIEEKLTYRYPRVRIFDTQKIRFDRSLLYTMVVTRVDRSPGITEYTPYESVRVFFYLLKGKVQYYIIKHYTSQEEGKYNTDIFKSSDTEGWHENNNKERCDYYFYHTFSLGTGRGDNRYLGFQNNCDFDYDPKYWKDPIYDPIRTPEMKTLQELGINPPKF